MTDNKTQGAGEMAALFRQQRAGVSSALDALVADLARVTAERDAAVRDMTSLATMMRKCGECDTSCCFACKYDSAEECPGCESECCFVWRGPEKEE